MYMYSIYPCITSTPILKPVSRKKKKTFHWHSWLQVIFWKNTAAISNLAPPAWNSITRFDANYLMFCLFGDTFKSFMFFFMFSSAVFLLHDRMRSICTTPVTFYEQGDLAMWQDSSWQRIFARSFLFNIFLHLCKKPKHKWVDGTFTEIILSLKYSRKCNRFSIVRLELNDWRIIESLMDVEWIDVHVQC